MSQLEKAGSDLVDTVISANPSNDDNLLLVLGALARNNDAAIQSKVVKELLRRLNVDKSTDNSSIVSINYALGNTGSRLAINALLSSLSHDDVNTQISAIRGLDVHANQPAVQQALITLLKTSTEDAVLEEVMAILNDALNNKVLQNPNKELLNAIVDMTIKLENANLYELIIQYLKLVGTNEAQEMISIITQQHNYGQVTNERANDMTGIPRIKRGSDWDASDSLYDSVASRSHRRRDVVNYPTHKAYIWGREHGVSKLKYKVGVGAFVGAYCGGTTNRFKNFAKAVTKAHVFGKVYNIGHLEYADYTSGNYLYHKVYLKLRSNVIININNRYDLSCRSSRKTLWNTTRNIFEFQHLYFIYVASLTYNVRGIADTRSTAGVCMCPLNLTACANLSLSITLRVTGGAEAMLLVS